MKKIIKSIMFIAATAMTLAGCTNDIDESTGIAQKGGSVALQIDAQIADTRTDRDEATGKLSWNATDELGVTVVGAEATDINLKAVTDGSGAFETSGGTQTAGTMYAYFPYREYATDGSFKDFNSTGATDIWISLNSGQTQSVAGAFEAGKYITMVSEPAALVENEPTKLVFKATASVLCFDIYGAEASGEKVKRVTAVSDNTIAGGYKYDLTTEVWDFASSIRRKAAIVNLAEPFAVPAAAGEGRVYMAVLPGTHTLKVTVETDANCYVFRYKNSVECAAGKIGTLKLNLAKADEKHVYINGYDLCIWGGDALNDAEGYLPGMTAIKITDGETPYMTNCASNIQGTEQINSLNAGTVAAYLSSRGWGDFTENYASSLYRLTEMPGCVKVGTSSGVGTFYLPCRAGIEGKNLSVKFDAMKWKGTNNNVHQVVAKIVEGSGLINGVGTEATVATDINDYAAGNLGEVSFIVTEATAETVISISIGTASKTPRAIVDNLVMDTVVIEQAEPLDTPQNLQLSMFAPITEDGVATRPIAFAWDEVAGASGYKYSAVINGRTEEGSTTANYLEIANSDIALLNATLKVRALGVDGISADSEWSETAEVAKDVLFCDDFGWINDDVNYSGAASTVGEWTDGPVSTFVAGNENVAALWTKHGYEVSTAYIYFNFGALKFGRTKGKANVGDLTLPAAALAGAAANSTVDINLDFGTPATGDIHYITFKVLNDDETAATTFDLNELDNRITQEKNTWFNGSLPLSGVNGDSVLVISNDSEQKAAAGGDAVANRFCIGKIKISKK